MLRVEAIVIAGAAFSAAPDEPQRAVRRRAVIRPSFYSSAFETTGFVLVELPA
jgi:hypothetical protein